MTRSTRIAFIVIFLLYVMTGVLFAKIDKAIERKLDSTLALQAPPSNVASAHTADATITQTLHDAVTPKQTAETQPQEQQVEEAKPSVQQPPAPEATAETASIAFDVQKIMEDRPLGKPEAPITIIEFASFTCPHCAHFHNTALGDVKKDLIDTGKAKLVFRDFPLDGMAVKASMLSRCVSPEKYHEVLGTIFKEQSAWVKSENPVKSLTAIATNAGMTETAAADCLANKDLETEILKRMQEAQVSYKIERTPSFIFEQDNKWLDGMAEFDEILKKHPFEHKHDHDHKH